MGRSRRAAILTAAMFAGVVGQAKAATTVGEIFTPNEYCGGVVALQTGSPGDRYVIPHDGVITAWGLQASSFPASDIRLKVARPAGGNDYTIIGESTDKFPTAGALNVYTDVAIPTLAGDVIGFYNGTIGECARETTNEYSWHRAAEDQPVGDTDTYTPFSGLQFNIAVSLERDCDRDGLGDETQDASTASCVPGGPPSAPSAGCGGKVATMVGTEGSDVLEGTIGPDVIAALGGRDTIRGLTGNDRVCGGAGRDTIKGGAGADVLKGGANPDVFKGGGGTDTCVGGPGGDSARTCEVERSI